MLLKFDVQVKLENNIFELYLFNKKDSKLCMVEDKAWSVAVQKAFVMSKQKNTN